MSSGGQTKLFKKSRIEDLKEQKPELAATYSNISYNHPAIKSGYRQLSNASSLVPKTQSVLVEPNTPDSRKGTLQLSFLNVSGTPMMNNIFRTTSADPSGSEEIRRESNTSLTSQDRISRPNPSEVSPRSSKSSVPGAKAADAWGNGLPPRSHGNSRDCSSIPLPAPPRKQITLSPTFTGGTRRTSSVNSNNEGRCSPRISSTSSPSSPFSMRSSGTAVGPVRATEMKDASIQAAPSSLTSNECKTNPIEPHNQGRVGSLGTAENLPPQLRPVSRSGENLNPWNPPGSRKASVEFDTSALTANGGSQSFRPNIFSGPFSRVGEETTDLLNSRKESPNLFKENSESPSNQCPVEQGSSPMMDPGSPTSVLELQSPNTDVDTQAKKTNNSTQCYDSIAPKEPMAGTRRFSSTMLPNPLRRDSSSISGLHLNRHAPSAGDLRMPTNSVMSLARRASAVSIHLEESAVVSGREVVSNEVSRNLASSVKTWTLRVNRNQWIQIPVLFNLFNDLIEFHEYQDRLVTTEGSHHGELEALSFLVSRISYSLYEVDGILLLPLFVKWERADHRDLLKKLSEAWQSGYNSRAFYDASMALLYVVSKSENDASIVKFTRLYKLWRWVGSTSNRWPVFFALLFLGVASIVLTLIGYFVSRKLHYSVHLGCTIAAILFVLLIVAFGAIIIWHNSFADAASIFLREDARFTPVEQEGETEFEVPPEHPSNASYYGENPLDKSFKKRCEMEEATGRGGAAGGTSNRTVSQYSFFSVLSGSGPGTDGHETTLQNGNPAVLFGASETVNHLFYNSNPGKVDNGASPQLKPVVDPSLTTDGVSARKSGGGDAQGSVAPSPVGRSRPMVRVTSEDYPGMSNSGNNTSSKGNNTTFLSSSLRTSSGGKGGGGGESNSFPSEERRLKRSESKKYLFSRSMTGSSGGGIARVAALVLTPSHLTAVETNDKPIMGFKKKEVADDITPPPPPPAGSGAGEEGGRRLNQDQYNMLVRQLEATGFSVVQCSTMGILDERFHQGINKTCNLMIPTDMWVSDATMRHVIARWLEVESRPIYFYQMGKSDEGDGATMECASPLTDEGVVGFASSVTTTLSRSSALCNDPNPPLKLCVNLPLSSGQSSRLYQRALERGTAKKAIMYSYVPPYSLGRRLGGGAFASVFEAVLDETGTRCAVKRIQVPSQQEDSEKPNSKLVAGVEEVELLCRVVHPHIVRYMYTERAGNTLSIFMERCAGGTLNSLLSSHGQLTPPRVKRILTEIISAVAFLHVKLIIHRDLKPDNILLSEDDTVRLIDFGSAGLRKENFAEMEGTLAYMAPEVLLGQSYGKECDVWSVGCVAADIFSVSLPQRSMSFVELHEFFTEMKDCLEVSTEIKPIQTFLLRCLQRDPSKRSECIELLEDEILKPESPAIGQWLLEIDRHKALSRLVSKIASVDSNMSLFST